MKRLPVTPKPVAEQLARFPANGEGVEETHAAFDRLLEACVAAGQPLPSADAVALRTAVGEIIANIVEHACAGASDAQVCVGLLRFPDYVEATFEDPGVPFSPPPPPTREELPQRGMGLSVVRASVDALDYARVGRTNRWRLVRRLQPARGSPRRSD